MDSNISGLAMQGVADITLAPDTPGLSLAGFVMPHTQVDKKRVEMHYVFYVNSPAKDVYLELEIFGESCEKTRKEIMNKEWKEVLVVLHIRFGPKCRGVPDVHVLKKPHNFYLHIEPPDYKFHEPLGDNGQASSSSSWR